MERYRLKNLIILILVLVNAFLLSALMMRKTEERSAARRTAEQLAALFAADGVSLDPAVIPRETPPPSVTLARDTGLEARAAVRLLGEGDLEPSDQGGGLWLYSGGGAEALFRSNGSFEAVGLVPETEAEAFCRAFCRAFSYGAPAFQWDEEGNGTGTAVCQYQGLPVYNGTVRFVLENRQVTAVSGTLLPEEGTAAVGEQAGLSAAGALNAFLQMRRENVVVASSVTDVTLCYELQSTSAASVTLVPAWCVVTDLANYYVNCLTGAVTEA